MAASGRNPVTTVTGGFEDTQEIERFVEQVRAYRSGRLDPEDFRRIRLWNGVYGQRGETDVHIVRVKIPQGRVLAHQVEALAEIADRYTRGFGHVTTRQNVEFSSVALHDVPAVLRLMVGAGLTSREACGDVVRNVVACPLAGVCPLETRDVSVAGEQLTRHFLRNPITQDLPRKFKIALSGCADDCAQTAINDLGIVPATRRDDDGREDLGYRVLVGGALGAEPHAAKPLEPFTRHEDLIITAEAVIRTYDRLFDHYADRRKRSHARLKVLVQRMGIEAFREAVFEERRKLASASGIERPAPPQPEEVVPAPTKPHANGQGGGFEAWLASNVVAQRQPGRFAAYVSLPLGDIKAEQLRALAGFLRQHGGELRTTVRQDVVVRDVDEAAIDELWTTLLAVGLTEATHDHAANVVSCPGAETCNLALTRSRGAAQAIREALVNADLADLPGIRINLSGCQNACGHHHTADIGLFGYARRDAAGNEAPGYRVLVGGGVDEQGSARFATYVVKLPARRAPEAMVRVLSRFVAERSDGERFGAWVDRVTPGSIKALLADLDVLPSKDESPEFFADWGDAEPFRVILGRGECAS